MAKHTINPAPNGATQWVYNRKRFTPGEEVELTNEQAADLTKSGAIGEPKAATEPEPNEVTDDAAESDKPKRK